MNVRHLPSSDGWARGQPSHCKAPGTCIRPQTQHWASVSNPHVTALSPHLPIAPAPAHRPLFHLRPCVHLPQPPAAFREHRRSCQPLSALAGPGLGHQGGAQTACLNSQEFSSSQRASDKSTTNSKGFPRRRCLLTTWNGCFRFSHTSGSSRNNSPSSHCWGSVHNGDPHALPLPPASSMGLPTGARPTRQSLDMGLSFVGV